MFTQPIAYHATNTPDRIAVESEAGEITYRRFDDDINKFANALREKLPFASAKGQIIAVSHCDNYVNWLINLALARLGYCTVSRVLKAESSLPSAVAIVISDDQSSTSLGVAAIQFSASEVRGLLENGNNAPVASTAGADADARISFSSGTTGQHKRVLMSHGTIVSRMKSGIFGSAMRADQRVYCQLPIGTFGGFGVPIRTWYMGGSVILSKISFAAIDHERPLTVVTTPADLHAMVLQAPADHVPFQNLTLVVGGAAVPSEILKHAKARLTKNIVLTYGSTETTTVAVASVEHKVRYPDLTGFVLPWIEVEIVDDEGTILPIGSTGHVRIRCEGMVYSYLDDLEATQSAFKQGWFYPGDRGRLDDQRGLYILGRSDNTININGQKISAEQMELRIGRLSGVTEVAVTTAPVSLGSLTAVILVVKGDGYSEKRVRETLEEEFKLRNYSIQTARKIPRNELGKIERHKLALLIDLRRLPSAKVRIYNNLRRGR